MNLATKYNSWMTPVVENIDPSELSLEILSDIKLHQADPPMLSLELAQLLSSTLTNIRSAARLNQCGAEDSCGIGDALSLAGSHIARAIAHVRGLHTTPPCSARLLNSSAMLTSIPHTGFDATSPDVVARGSAGSVADPFTSLTRREHDVLLGIIGGKVNKLIARDLGISPRTVEYYRSQVMTKTRSESLSALVALYTTFQIRQAAVCKRPVWLDAHVGGAEYGDWGNGHHQGFQPTPSPTGTSLPPFSGPPPRAATRGR